MSRKVKAPVTERAARWRFAWLPYVEGSPRLGEVMDACKAEGAAERDEEWQALAQTLADEWSAWLKTLDQFISEGMLEAMGEILDKAGVELEKDDE